MDEPRLIRGSLVLIGDKGRREFRPTVLERARFELAYLF